MRHPSQRHLTTFMVVLLVLAAFIAGYQVSNPHAGIRPVFAALTAPVSARATLVDTVSLKPVSLFQEALSRVQTEYVEPISDPQQLAYGAIRGMLAQLKDPYTRFMDPKEFKEFNDDNAGHFAGIGATLNMVKIPALTAKEGEGTIAPTTCPSCGAAISDVEHFRVSVVETLPNSPAKKAGLLSGDMILKVDDTITDGLTVGEVAGKIHGTAGTDVKLTIGRKGEQKPLIITITRAQIEVPAVQSKMLDGQIGYLRLLQFNEKTRQETSAALMDFNKAGARGLVLDLRNNPGGLLTECIKVASMFLPENQKIIVSTQSRDGRRDPNTRVGEQLWTKPMVVLVNKGSASASEILSGALQDYKRGTIIGESTFGKALVQTVIRMSDGSAMAVTTAHYYTPNGHDVGKKGVAPDVAVPLDKDTTQLNEKDNQALEALRLLKEQMQDAQ